MALLSKYGLCGGSEKVLQKLDTHSKFILFDTAMFTAQVEKTDDVASAIRKSLLETEREILKG